MQQQSRGTAAAAAASSALLEVELRRDSFQESFGLEISGGRDAGPGRPLQVSDVYVNSPAQRAGLQPRDIILAVDDIAARGLSHADTVDIIRTALDIRLKIERPFRGPDDDDAEGFVHTDADMTDLEGGGVAAAAHKRARKTGAAPPSPLAPSVPLVEPIVNGTPRGSSRDGSVAGRGATTLNNGSYAWIDVQRQPCSPPPEEADLQLADDAGMYPTRKAALLVSDDVHLGLLIRGGSEYGLGVYVTGLDKASAAENAQLKVGDQILTVNNYDFRHISHSRAVRVLRTHRHMTLTVRHVGKLPYARRLSPSTTTQSPNKLVAPVASAPISASPVTLSPKPAPAAGPANPSFGHFYDSLHEEIIRLTREANQDLLTEYREPDPTLELLRSLGLHDVEVDDYNHDIQAQLEMLESDWSATAITANRHGRTKQQREKSEINEHWLRVVENSAETLLDDDSQTEALMYFLNEYINGTVEVDALVLSLFHLMDSTHKLPLLDDIRAVIAPPDIARFDSLTSGMKAEWMMSPAKLFANITPSTSQLAFITPTDTTPPPALPLKSALKSPSVSMSFPDTPVNPYLMGLPAIPSNSQANLAPPHPSQSGALLAPPNGLGWPTETLLTPAPVTQVLVHTPVTPTVTKFVYDAPNIEMDMFGQHSHAPVMTSITAPTPTHMPPAHGSPHHLPGAYMAPGPSVPPLIPGRKSHSTENVPSQGMTSASAYDFRGDGFGRYHHPQRPGYAGMGGGSSYSIHDPYIPPGSLELRRSPQPPPGRLKPDREFPVNRGRRASHFQPEGIGGRGSVAHLYPPQLSHTSRWHNAAAHSRERDSSEGHIEWERRPANDGSISPVYSFRSRSNSGDLHSERDYPAGTHRKFSYDDDMMSTVDMLPYAAAKQRPLTLQVPLENKIGPAKGDAKTPVVIETVTVKKNAPVLGIAIEGGTETKQPLPRIINIQPKGCAHLNGRLKVGHVILSVNGKKLDGLNHAQAVNLITETFLDKAIDKMEFVVKEVNKLESSG